MMSLRSLVGAAVVLGVAVGAFGQESERGAVAGTTGRRLEMMTTFKPGARFSVITVGTGAPQYNAERSGPSSMIQLGGAYYLVDMGNGTQAKLNQLGVSFRSIVALVLTHHHLDHNEELSPLLVHESLQGRAFEVVGPPGTAKYVDFMQSFYAEDMAYRIGRMGRSASDLGKAAVREVKGGESFEMGGMKAKTAKVNHSIHTVAYRFDVGGQSIVISGDLSYSDSLVELAKGADILVIDAGGAIVRQGAAGRLGHPRIGAGGGMQAHSTLTEVCEMAVKAGVKRLVLTHISPGMVDEEATRKAIGATFKGDVIIAKDGLEVLPAEREAPAKMAPVADLSGGGKSPAKRLARAYTIVGTGQSYCYGNIGQIPAPAPGQPFYGQDAQQSQVAAAYRDQGDGTVLDENTGLTWVKARGEKLTWAKAMAGAAACRVGGHTDWRVPTIKELYSLTDFDGGFRSSAANSIPYLDTHTFGFAYGNEAKGERGIDCQDWSSTEYGSLTMNGNPTVFGVNFADGRIKGYPKTVRRPGSETEEHELFVRYVRGNEAYGKNDFKDNGGGTITDQATGLMWSKADSKVGMNWEQALAWVQARNKEKYLGFSDWRLPTAKELQSLVDYTRCPAITKSPAISPLFQTTALPDGDFPFFWTSTTHLDTPPGMIQGAAAIYVAFGRATGWMQFPPGRGAYRLLDVHGAGAQRSDPKVGNPLAYPYGRGPQGDVIRIYNFVRCVRSALTSGQQP